MATPVQPPVLMGVMYRPGTRYPCSKKLGPGIILFNRTTGCPAQVDSDGWVVLEASGDYVAERGDSDRLRKLAEESRRKNNSKASWSKISEGFSTLTTRRHRSASSVGRSLTKLSLAVAAMGGNGQQDAAQTETPPPQPPQNGNSMGGEYTTAPPASENKSSFYWTLRGRKSMGRFTGTKSVSVQELMSIPRNTGAATKTNEKSIDQSRSSENLPGQTSEEVSQDDLLRKPFQSNPSLSSLDSPPTKHSQTIADISEENHISPSGSVTIGAPASPAPSSFAHPTAANAHSSVNDLTSLPPLHIEICGTLRIVWASLKSDHLTLYNDPELSNIVESIQMTENSLAVADDASKHEGAFHLLQDDNSYHLFASSREDMLKCVSTINTAALQASCKEIAAADTEGEDMSWDYRKEYEIIVKSFNLVELVKVKLPEARKPDGGSTAIRNRSSILRRRERALSVNNLRSVHMQILQIPAPLEPSTQAVEQPRGAAKTEIAGDTSLISPTEETSMYLQAIEHGAISSAISMSNVRGENDSHIGSEFNAERINQQVQTPIREVEHVQEMIERIGGSGARRRPLYRMNSKDLVQYDNQDDQSQSLTPTSDKPKINAATLEKLVERLADEHSSDMVYIDCFLLGYRHFSNAPAVMDAILSRMGCVPPSDASGEERKFVIKWRPVIRMRLVAVVKLWVERYFIDFVRSEQARKKLEEFTVMLEHFETDEFDNPAAVPEQKTFFSRLAKLLRKLIIHQETNYVKPQEHAPKPEKAAPPCDFLSVDPKFIAYQLTLAEFKRFRAVRPLEILINLWEDTNDPAVRKELVNLTEIVSAFNQISYWVATEICTQPELPARVKVLERMIKIAKMCKRERNYNSTVAIMAGLNNSAVLRLKQTWAAVQDKHMWTFKELESLVSQTQNFKNYRHILETMEHEGYRYPFVPFLGLFLKDLLFWNENPKLTEAGLINFSKVRSIGTLVQTLRQWQDNEYAPPPGTVIPDMVVQYCNNLRAISNSAIYKYSCLCERKNGTESTRLIDKWTSKK